MAPVMPLVGAPRVWSPTACLDGTTAPMDREQAPVRVALFHGWAGSPVWYRTPGGFGPVDLATLPISRALHERLVAWNEFADVTLSANDDEWPSSSVESECTAAGSELADELHRELGIDVIDTPDGDDDVPTCQRCTLMPLTARWDAWSFNCRVTQLRVPSGIKRPRIA